MPAPGRDQPRAGLRSSRIGRSRLALRRLAGQEVIERRPQAVDVHGGGQDGVGPELLGGRIRGRPGDEPLVGRRPPDPAGQPEIGQDRLVASPQHDVRRLDVAVQDAGAGVFLISARRSLQLQLVHEIQRVGDLGQDAGRPARVLGSPADPPRQRLAVDQLGRDERRAGLRAALDDPRAEIAHDVAMADVGQDLGLADQQAGHEEPAFGASGPAFDGKCGRRIFKATGTPKWRRLIARYTRPNPPSPSRPVMS